MVETAPTHTTTYVGAHRVDVVRQTMTETDHADDGIDETTTDDVMIPDPEGFGGTITIELSKEELLDIRTALWNHQKALEEAGNSHYAQDMADRRARLSHALDALEAGEDHD